jgi:hypothetical protein
MDTILSILVVGLAILEGVLILLILTAPTYSVSTFSLNTDSGVLTINATFFGSAGPGPVYTHYIISNATEELPNGTIIRPAKSYVEAAIAAACTTANYELHVGNGNYYAC